jgi:hypothetical protein
MRTTLLKWLKAGDGLNDGAFLELFFQVADPNCRVRPGKIAERLGFVISELTIFEREGKKSFSSSKTGPSLGAQVSAKLEVNRYDGKGQIAILTTNAGWGGAGNSRFLKVKEPGFHVVLLLGYCSSAGEEYIVVYDPDVTATLVSENTWAACSKSGREVIIKRMILGEGEDLGALVRYIKV